MGELEGEQVRGGNEINGRKVLGGERGGGR